MNQSLFYEFPEITKNDWIAQVSKDLKGKNFDDTLIWHTLENINVQPYYSIEDLKNLPFEQIQAAQKNKSWGTWQNRPLIKYTNEKDTNGLIISYLQKGAEGVIIDLRKIQINHINWLQLLNNIKLSDTPIYFKTLEGRDVLKNLAKFIHYQPKGGFQVDLVTESFSNKTSILNKATWENTKEIIEETAKFPHFQGFMVESNVYHNVGANAVQELAFTLATGVEYLDKLTDLGLNLEQIVSKFEFSISVGTNYFIEIAKLRALRYLWAKIGESYNSELFIENCQINCQTSSFYNSSLSPYTNMLRATTEAMSAVMGGCNSLTILPYNEVFNSYENAEFGARIAQNVSIIMKEEAYLDKTSDPSAGSYYIENLTFQLANEAWKLFQKVEGMGGIIASFENGFISQQTEESFQKKVENLKNGKVMVGVNKFRVETENLSKKEDIDVTDQGFLKNKRLAEVFE